MFRSSDDSRDGFGCFRKDGIGVNSIQADVGGDVKTRHLRLAPGLCRRGYNEYVLNVQWPQELRFWLNLLLTKVILFINK